MLLVPVHCWIQGAIQHACSWENRNATREYEKKYKKLMKYLSENFTLGCKNAFNFNGFTCLTPLTGYFALEAGAQFAMDAVMHHRHIEPMKIDMYKLRQTTI